jgi:hypothetical protein
MFLKELDFEPDIVELEPEFKFSNNWTWNQMPLPFLLCNWKQEPRFLESLF